MMFYALICALTLTSFAYANVVDLPSLSADFPLNENFFDNVRAALIEQRLHDASDLPKEQQVKRAEEVATAARRVPTPILVEDWPAAVDTTLGQITAVAVDPYGNPVIFHRAERYWNEHTFDEHDNYVSTSEGPITAQTINLLDPKTGAVRYGWGRNVFYMPHGMTIDVYGNYWLTDVALHQVFKFKPFGRKPILTIGKRFKPGASTRQLCKPTSVAVASTGEFFVADGYCNNRILKFNAAGHLLRVMPEPQEFLSLQVPHALTLLEHLDLLCVADRENMRVVCPKAGLKSSKGEGKAVVTIQEPDLGRVFGVASCGDIVFAVNGPSSTLPVRGFTIDPRSESIIARWGEFKKPHAVVVSRNGTELYVTEVGKTKAENRIWKYILV